MVLVDGSTSKAFAEPAFLNTPPRTAPGAEGSERSPPKAQDSRSEVSTASPASDGECSPCHEAVLSGMVGGTSDGATAESQDDLARAKGVQSDLEAAAREIHLERSADERICWEALFVVLPVFSGYAALFGLQHEIKSRLGIMDRASSASHEFGFACSFLYIFNLIFRFAHNVLFGWLSPRGRVYIAMTSMMCSMLIISVVIMILENHNMCWVFFAYALGGVAIGSFESNFLCCLTPLGHETKHIAILGIPIGITSVLVGGFLAMSRPFNVPATAIYIAVAVAVLCGMLLLSVRIPSRIDTQRQAGMAKFSSDIRAYRSWLPQLWHYPLATAVDMFSLSCFSPGVALFIYDKKSVNLMPDFALQTDIFFAIYNVCNMVGGLTGRWLSYRIKPRHPLVYAVFNIVGIALLLSHVPILAPLSTFLIMLGDGLIYGANAKHIDTTISREYNLVALSYWLFVGDFGSVIGSNLISYVRDWVVGH